MFDPKLKEALGRVQKPGRYTGGEPGSGTVQAIFAFGGGRCFCCLFCFLFGRVFFFGILSPF